MYLRMLLLIGNVSNGFTNGFKWFYKWFQMVLQMASSCYKWFLNDVKWFRMASIGFTNGVEQVYNWRQLVSNGFKWFLNDVKWRRLVSNMFLTCRPKKPYSAPSRPVPRASRWPPLSQILANRRQSCDQLASAQAPIGRQEMSDKTQEMSNKKCPYWRPDQASGLSTIHTTLNLTIVYILT